MRKVICLLLVTCVFAISGCNTTPTFGSSDNSQPVTKVLADKGLELIGKVDKLAECEEYVKFLTAGDEVGKVIEGIAGNDYTTPNGIFVVDNLDTIISETMISQANLPKDVAKIAKDKVVSTLPVRIAGMSGVTNLAAISTLGYEESFIYEGLQSNVIYLYTYGNGYNFMVNFNSNDENIVNANVTIVINDELSKCTSKEAVSEFFKNFLDFEGVSVNIVSEVK